MSITRIAWSSEILANQGATSDINSGVTQQLPVIAGLSNGHFVMLWEDPVNTVDNSPGQDFIGQTFDARGARVGGFFQANSFDEDGERDIDVAALTDGRFVVVYWEADASSSAIRFDILSPTGANIRAGTVVPRVFSGTRDTGRVFEPRVDALENGTFAITRHDRATGFLSQLDTAKTRISSPAGTAIGPVITLGVDSDGHDVAARFDDYFLFAAAEPSGSSFAASRSGSPPAMPPALRPLRTGP